MIYSTTAAGSGRRFRQEELTSLISFAMSELSKFKLAWRDEVVRPGKAVGRDEQIVVRVSPSRVAREARDILGRYSGPWAEQRMSDWIRNDVVANEHRANQIALTGRSLTGPER